MDDKKERNLTLIEASQEVELETQKVVKSHQTNPIMKKLAQFHLEKASKLKVKDLFKNPTP